MSPVQKVISLMNGMVEKGKTEMESEKDQFQQFVRFCENTTVEKRRSIEETNEAIELLTANIEKAAADASQLAKEIQEHQAMLDKTSAEKAKATAVRKQEAADFIVALKDYDDSVDAIGRALTVLKEKSGNEAQASLLQLASVANTKKISPTEASAFLDDFLRGRTEGGKVSPSLVQDEQPVALGYEGSSGGVIGLLEKLEDQFKVERMDLKKGDLLQKNAYNTLVVGLDAETDDNSKDKDLKSQAKSAILSQTATDEGDLAEAKEALAADTKYKKDLETTWSKRTAEFGARQQLRKEEVEALTKATEIVSGQAVSGAEDKHRNLLQTGSTALASTKRSMLRSEVPSRMNLAKLFQERAVSLNSQELALVARRLESSGPFDGVVTLIKDLISKKKAQSSKDATKQAWCEGEMTTNKKTREEKSDEVEDMQASIDKVKSVIESLGSEVATLSGSIKETGAAIAEATALRTREKNNNTATIADAKAAQAAVAQAMSVLNEFYAKAGQATALLQTKAHQPIPQAFDGAGEKAYQGMGAQSGGVIAMMEVIQSDFARLEAETSSAEASAAADYEEFMNDSKQDQLVKEKDVEHTNEQKEREVQKLAEKTGDLGAIQKELDAALEYYESLKPKCADAEASYEEQKRLREEEMATLQQALDSLNVAR